jgi:hypothetical protein
MKRYKFLKYILLGIVIVVFVFVGIRYLEMMVLEKEMTKLEGEMIEHLQLQIGPNTPLRKLSETQVDSIIKKCDCYDSRSNKTGLGFNNRFGLLTNDGIRLVIDTASRLMWQKTGYWNSLTFTDAVKLIEGFNKIGFAGYNDWRLPTIEEALTLMEPESKKNMELNSNIYARTEEVAITKAALTFLKLKKIEENELERLSGLLVYHIDPILTCYFQERIWTSDVAGILTITTYDKSYELTGGQPEPQTSYELSIWTPDFGMGWCSWWQVDSTSSLHVRAVRSIR